MGRTHLTTAPGEPVDEPGRSHDEHWVRGPALPTEPVWPSRFRRWYLAAALLVLVAAVAALLVELNVRSNSFDPSLDPERFGPTEDAGQE